MSERDKYLTEAMGECWHEEVAGETMGHYECSKCDDPFYYNDGKDFSTWDKFGQLWNWAIEQEWWNIFFDDVLHEEINETMGYQLRLDLINPDNFANAIYEYLKERKRDEVNMRKP